MKNLQQAIKKATEETIKHFTTEDTKKYSHMAEKLFKEGGMVKDSLGIPDETIEGIYGQAYLLYNTGKYRDASELFRLLIMLNSLESKYMMGLAACFHMLKEYEAATSTYTLCSIIDPDNPIPHFHASDCYLEMGDKVSAIIALEMATKRSGEKPEFVTLKERAEITLKGLKKEVAQTKGARSKEKSPAKKNK